MTSGGASLPERLAAPGVYWCAVVSYPDGSAVLGTYGPWWTQQIAGQQVERLRAAGVYVNERWEIMPLRLLDLGKADNA